jgi:hypothetical protein
MSESKSETAQFLVADREGFEQLLLRLYGYKFDLQTEVSYSKGGERAYAEFFQNNVMVGSQLGLLGEAIINVDLMIRFSSSTEGAEWWAEISLRWQHPSGSNGYSIGNAWYNINRDTNYPNTVVSLPTKHGVFVVRKIDRR